MLYIILPYSPHTALVANRVKPVISLTYNE